MNLSAFQIFFDCCVGNWKTERTYHYLNHQEVERSKTDFKVDPLTVPQRYLPSWFWSRTKSPLSSNLLCLSSIAT